MHQAGFAELGRAFFAESRQLLLLADRQTGCIIDVNQAALDYLRITYATIVGAPLSDWLQFPGEVPETRRQHVLGHPAATEQGEAVQHIPAFSELDQPGREAAHVQSFQRPSPDKVVFSGLLRRAVEGDWIPISIARSVLDTSPLQLLRLDDPGKQSTHPPAEAPEATTFRWVAVYQQGGDLPERNWVYVDLSPALPGFLGLMAESFGPSWASWYQHIHLEDRGQVYNTLHQAFASAQTTLDLDYRVVHQDGSVRWVREHLHWRRDASGVPIQLEGHIHDITPWRMLERTLRQRELQLNRIIDSNPNGILLLDLQGRVSYTNAAAEEILGLGAGELLHRHWDEIPLLERLGTIPLTPQAVGEEFPVARATGEWCLEHPDGRQIEVAAKLTFVRDEQQELLGMVVTLTDISARKQVEKALRSSEEHLSRIVETVADGILLIDRNFRVTFANAAAERLFGQPRRELTARCWYELPWTAPRREQVVTDLEIIHRSVILEGRALHGQERIIQRSPEVRFIVASSFVPMTDPLGEVSGMLISFTDISERIHVEEKLLRSEERFRALVEKSSDGILLFNASGKVVYASSSTVHILGYDAPSLRSIQTLELIHPDDRNTVKASAAWLMDHPGEARSHSLRCLHRDGNWRYVELVACNRLEDVSVRAVVVNYRDITEKHQAEEALRRSEQRYRRLFERNLAGVYRTSLNGEIIDCNDSFAQIFGYPVAQAICGLNVGQFYADEHDRDAMLQQLHQRGVLTNQELRMKAFDGSTVWILANVSLLTDESITRLEGTIFDITERKRAEEALAQQHTLLSGLINSIPDLIFTKDCDGYYLSCNDAFERYAGKPKWEIIGRTDAELFVPSGCELWQRVDQEVLQTREARRVEGWLPYRESRNILVEMVLTPLITQSGELLGLIGIGRDLTERKRLEDQLRQSGKMEAIGQLAGGIAHDFRNLLTIILGNASMLQEYAHLPKGLTEQCRAIVEAAKQASDLTTNLLGFARRTTMRFEPIDLNQTIASVIELLRRTIDPRITIEFQGSPDLWTVDADANNFSQVLINLCLNARDAMDDGGRLCIDTSNVVLDESVRDANLDARGGEFVCVRVSDTGCGMTPEVRARIFEPFFTTKPVGQGTGLGLSMVHGIVNLHKGWIECESTPNEGSNFHILIPRSEKAPIPIPVPPSPPTGGQETILLVDDEPMIRELGKTILTSYGYRVLLANDGLEAVEIYQQNADAIELVLLDLTMPNLSGKDALQQIREIDPNVRVVFASGYSADDLNLSDDACILGFISKPFRPNELAQAVRTALDQLKATLS